MVNINEVRIPPYKEVMKVIGNTKNAVEGRAALKKKYGVNDKQADEIIKKTILGEGIMVGDVGKKDSMSLQSKIQSMRKSMKKRTDEDGHSDVPSAIRQCKTMMEDAKEVMSKLQSMNNEDTLPSWWTNKLAVASNSMNKLRDYILNPIDEDSFGVRRLPLGKRNPDNPIKKKAAALVMTLPPSRPLKDLLKKKTDENFMDGKNPQDKGDSKRHGVPTKSSVSNLRKVAKQGGRKGQLAHWMANMKAGRAKKKRKG